MSEFWSDTLATGRIYLQGKFGMLIIEEGTLYHLRLHMVLHNHGFVRIAKYESTDEENQYSK